MPKGPATDTLREHYGVRRAHNVVHVEGQSARRISFENYTLMEMVRHFEAKPDRAMQDLLHRYHFERTFPDLSNFRMGPNMFGETALDWIAFLAPRPGQRESDLIAHGVATRISWSGDPADLPRGWTGAVRASYEEAILRGVPPTTLVGLFISAEKGFQKHGWAAQVVQQMKRIARESGLRDIIIPLRLPTRYEPQNAKMPYEEFAFIKRDDGQYQDHWLRMHVRLGAEVIGVSAVSHQHAMHPDDMDQQFHCGRIERTGDYLVKWNDEYFSVFVDIEHGFAIMNQGCVWVRHTLD
jgi:hypothetical protein